MALTDLQIRRIKPRDHEYYLTDENGLFLRVYPSGKKAWTLRYTYTGKNPGRKRLSLGLYPAVSLAMARERTALALRDVENGIDPAASAREERDKARLDPTFHDLLEEFWERELSKSKTGGERRRLVKKDALPSWKRRKVNTITRRDAVLLLDKVRERAPIGANRLQGVLVRMFNFAAERGMIEFSPLGGMRKTKETPRSRVLSDEEIKLFWGAMNLENTEIDIYRLTKLALKMILLTGQRPGEVARMKWENLSDTWWVIPADARKNNEENRVPIVPMMQDILDEAKIYSSDSSWVFRSTHNEGTPITVGAMTNAIRRHWSEMGITEGFSSHDIRRTLRTRLAEIGIEDVIAERVLGHKLQGLLAVYNRYPYDKEKRQAMQEWERKLKSIIGLKPTDGKVISIGDYRHG
jgi:integrase